MNPVMETTMQTNTLLRRCLLAIALSAGLALSGCDDVEVGGVGVSTGLPSAFVVNTTDPADIGVGSVHWIGNPRW